jgi:hypothetical protein
MRYYRYSEDWISHLTGDFRESLIEELRAFNFAKLQRYPPPKLTGLPFGNETRILARFLRGRSSQLDASALSIVYRSLLSEDERTLYKAFRRNDFLSTEEWSDPIGRENVDAWIENKCLRADANGKLQCQFTVVSVDGLVFANDPLIDQGEIWEPPCVVDKNGAGTSEDIKPFFHTYIGLDSLRMIEVMEQMELPRPKRYLDCGPGAGGLLLYFGRRADEAVGVDLNPRAAALAQFNAEFNNLSNCKTYADDALTVAGKYGQFDLVTWNLPFVFLPEEDEHNYIDAFGGDMGIELCLKFIRILPDLLTRHGVACLEALAPITDSGENVLETRLRELIGPLGLDCEVRVDQTTVAHTRDLWQFHRRHGLSKFESVYLTLRRGSGRLSRIEASLPRRLADRVRERLYTRKYK